MQQYRSSLRQTPACIIDADDEAVTFAIRIPLGVIQENHHFLTAISDAAGGGVLKSARLHRRWVAVRRALSAVRLAASATATVLLLAGGGYAASLLLAGPVVQIAAANAVPDHLKPGEALRIEFVSRRLRNCPGTVDRFVTAELDGQIVWRERLGISNRTKPGNYAIVSRRIVLPSLLPGAYHFTEVLHSDCGEFDGEIATSPAAPFIIDAAT